MTDYTKQQTVKMVLGPVTSGKTRRLEQTADRLLHRDGEKALFIKFRGDNRFNEDECIIQSRCSFSPTSAIPCRKIMSEISKNVMKKSTIAIIDEGQFFADLLEFVKYYNEELGKPIIIYALNSSYKQTMFQPIVETMPYAHEIEYISAVCSRSRCNNNAMHSILLDSSRVKMVTTNGIEVGIGDQEYRAVCGYCRRQFETDPNSIVWKDKRSPSPSLSSSE